MLLINTVLKGSAKNIKKNIVVWNIWKVKLPEWKNCLQFRNIV